MRPNADAMRLARLGLIISAVCHRLACTACLPLPTVLDSILRASVLFFVLMLCTRSQHGIRDGILPCHCFVLTSLFLAI